MTQAVVMVSASAALAVRRNAKVLCHLAPKLEVSLDDLAPLALGAVVLPHFQQPLAIAPET
eukprot:3355060-Karenia_brevis.AAC.1